MFTRLSVFAPPKDPLLCQNGSRPRRSHGRLSFCFFCLYTGFTDEHTTAPFCALILRSRFSSLDPISAVLPSRKKIKDSEKDTHRPVAKPMHTSTHTTPYDRCTQPPAASRQTCTNSYARRAVQSLHTTTAERRAKHSCRTHASPYRRPVRRFSPPNAAQGTAS